ncbi:MAG TPA: glycosyltransferase, partial [Thermodesulfobacteriota bacterium]|nr:glycosyltransferase [Thermodesulfobacteriota bacterium]
IFVVLVFFGLVLYGFQIVAVRSTLSSSGNRKDHSNPSPSFPPISILKPLKGLEDNLFGNLESFCVQDYPEYEVIFSLQDENDPAYKVVRKVKDKFPDKPISIVVERCHHGFNPKVNNLFPAYRHSKYPIILISDSNVMVDPYYLRTIVKPMDNPDVGLVCNLIKGIGGKTLGSIFENLHLNSFILGNICFLDRYLGIPCVVGKSMLMRKTDLEAVGGLTSVKDVLAEDHFIGEKIRGQKQRVVISNYLINNVNEYWNLRKFINRHVRWGKMRWKIGGVKYLLELTINPVFTACLPLLLWGPTEKTLSILALVCLIKIIGDFYLGRSISTPTHPLVYLLSPIKDLLMGVLWFVPLADDTVVWRGNRYLMGKDTRLSLCPERGGAWKTRIMEGIKAKIAW